MSVDKQRLTIFVDHFKLLKSSIIVILGITYRNKLQKLQNRAARVLTFSDYDEDAGYLFELLGWKNPAHQHEIEKATMVYKYLHRLAPEYLSARFAIRETAYNLRDSDNKLCIPLPRNPKSPFLICEQEPYPMVFRPVRQLSGIVNLSICHLFSFLSKCLVVIPFVYFHLRFRIMLVKHSELDRVSSFYVTDYKKRFKFIFWCQYNRTFTM